MIKTQRVFWNQYNSPAKVQRLLKFLSQHREICDEISFFTESDGGDGRFIPLEECRQRAEHLRVVLGKASEAGFSTAINILNTIGHTDEGGVEQPRPPWRTMVGANGERSIFCSCPRDEQFLRYVGEKYAIYGGVGAQTYWIDDDVRLMFHAPVDWGCFCDTCVTVFVQNVMPEVSNDSLREAVFARGPIRNAWIEYNSRAIADIIAACVRGVVAVSPGANMGFMSAWLLSDSGADWPRWSKELKAGGGRGWIRPGGGYWSDEQPYGYLGKLQACGFLREAAPDLAATYEIENYPYVLGSKSAKFTGTESLLAAVALRIDGVMFDVLDQAGNDLQLQSSWTDTLDRYGVEISAVSSLLDDSPLEGWRTPIGDQYTAGLPDVTSPVELDPLPLPSWQLQDIGVPLGQRSEVSVGHIVDGKSVRGLTNSEVDVLLRKPTILDGDAVSELLVRGLGDLIGVTSVSRYDTGVVEVFSDDPVNEGFVGYQRAVTLSYFNEISCTFETRSPSARVLSRLVGVDQHILGAALVLTESSHGAPVLLIGHLPWRFLLSPARAEQLRAVLHEMTPELPRLRVAHHRVSLWLRRSNGDRVAVLHNASFDEVRGTIDGMSGDILYTYGDTSAKCLGASVQFVLSPASVLILR